MSLCWRGTFIDVDESAHGRLVKRRSSSTPAGSDNPAHDRRTAPFEIERDYIKALSKRVGFQEATKEPEHQEVSSRVSRSLGMLPSYEMRSLGVLPAYEDDSASYEDEDDQFFAESATVTEAVQSLSSLPFVRSCGTTVTTMDSLCSLGDTPELDEIAGLCGVPEAWDAPKRCELPDPPAEPPAEPPALPRMISCASLDAHEAEYATFVDPWEEQASMPFDAGPPPMPMPDSDNDEERAGWSSISSEDDPVPAAWGSVSNAAWSLPSGADASLPAAWSDQGTTALVSGNATEAEQHETYGLELPAPRIQRSTSRLPPLGRPLALDSMLSSEQPDAGSSHRLGSRGEQHLGQTAEECQRGDAADRREMDLRADGAPALEGERSGGRRAVMMANGSFQGDNVIDVAFSDQVGLIFVGQDITSAKEIAALRCIVSSCCVKGEAISAILVWMELAPPKLGHEDHLPDSGMLQQVTEAVSMLSQMPYPVLGFALGSCGVFTTLLAAGCDQLLALPSADFLIQDGRGGFRRVSAELGMELGLVSRLEGNTADMWQACSAFLDQVDLCSKEELARVKLSLRTRSQKWHLPLLLAPSVVGPPSAVCTRCLSNQATVPVAAHAQTPASGNGMGRAGEQQDRPWDKDVTSLMLRNLPCRLTQPQLMSIVASLGFAGKVDYVHFPKSKGSAANPGYAFVSFVSPEDAARFAVAFKEFRFDSSRTSKVPDAKPARVQGRLAMIEQLEHRQP